MFLSICVDRLDGESQSNFRMRAEAIEALAPDLVLLARDDATGTLTPPSTEALVNIGWMTGVLKTPAIAAGLPALHSLPFHVARALSAADFLSDGRAGWMPLLSNGGAFDATYGATLAGGDAAERADDFVRATRALWDSWDDNTLILDKIAGRYLDSGRVRRVAYKGSHFATMGSLNAARPPQGHPLLIRDLDDRPEGQEPADILIGASLPPAHPGTVRLLKITTDLQSAAARVAAGEADGLHLAGPDAFAMLSDLSVKTAVAAAPISARKAFGLPHPINRFSEQKTA